MRPRRKSQLESGPTELLEEAVHLLRRGPAGALACYYIGSLPFVLALLYFWTDMSRNPFAPQRLAAGAMGMALLFVWMKCWQTAFARRLLAHLCGEDPPEWTGSRVARLVAVQAAIQPWSLPTMPLVLLLPWVSAFFHNASVLGAGGRTAGLGTVIVRSAGGATRGITQVLGVRLILLLLALFVFANISEAIVWPAQAMKAFLDIETPFSRGGFNAFNTTFVAILLGATYLCVGPVVKAYYVLRCFYDTSLETGQDLQADLKRLGMNRRPGAKPLAAVALVLLVWAASPSAAQAAPDGSAPGPGTAAKAAPEGKGAAPAVAPGKLDRSIRNVIARREFTWRMPREKAAKVKDQSDSALQRVLDKVGKLVGRFFRWLGNKLSRPRGPRTTGFGLAALLELIPVALILLLVVVVAAIIWLIVKAILDRSKTKQAEAEPAGAEAAPDPADESVTADEMPEEGWLEMARNLFRQGDRRLALRAMYLASLSMLAACELIVIARFKSNREYQAELARRSHALPGLAEAFAGNVTFFEDSWYGMHDVTDTIVRHFTANQKRIRDIGQT